MPRFNKKQKNGQRPWYRELHEGMGQAVAERTILRKVSLNDGRTLSQAEVDEGQEQWRWENWGDVAERVALGNSLLDPVEDRRDEEYKKLRKHIGNATLLMSGRHLQHGDSSQPNRNAEVFTNCATAATSYLLFYLLLNGSGVGRSYDDDMVLVDWDCAPTLRCVLDENHPDFDYSAHESARDALHKYCEGRQGKIKRGLLPEEFGHLVEYGRDTLWYTLPDSREGWAKALEIWENAAFEKIHKDKMLILDFSKIRHKGSPIGGMQNRPASGPVALMNAFVKASTLKGGGVPKWKQALYIDHYFAECVLVGGARRAARMSTKSWRDMDVLDFITIKRPIEYYGKRWEEIVQFREEQAHPPFGFLWSSNNSVTVDEEFWELLSIKKNQDGYMSELAQHARRVFRMVTEASYADGTGEPALINVHLLVQNNKGLTNLNLGDYVGSKKYEINEDTQILMQRLARKVQKKQYCMITNPCVTAETWVQTSEGPQLVRDLIDKPFTAVVDGRSYSATGFWETGTKPVFKLTTALGNSLRLTDNHKLLVVSTGTSEWKELKDIRLGDSVALARSLVTSSVDQGAQEPQWDRSAVVSIEGDGLEPVYDCTVEDIHAFDANGILAHNCGEIPLLILGGYCVLADVVPFHADTLDDAEEAFRAATRALIRVNLMDCLYKKEVERTNRIGVGMTGVHEFAWKFFKLGFRDLIDEEKSKEFWLTLARFHKAVREEAELYCAILGVPMPHTALTIKPAGTTSKLFGLTEGWHLPSLAWYLRWVQFRNDDPLVQAYKAKGYPIRKLKSYEGTTIVGFPTAPTITELGMGTGLVTAGEATPEEQYKWLQLGEKYWLKGFDGKYPTPDISNQISYTLKYDPKKVDFQQFRAMVKEYQPTIKCCSVMPQTDSTSYEYQPEQPMNKASYEEAMRHITGEMTEDIDKVHIDCAGGSCPVDFTGGQKEVSEELSEDIDPVHIQCDMGCPDTYRETK